MAYLQKYVFPFGSRLLSWPPPSRLSVKWARAVSFIFLPRRPTVDTSSRRLQPPHAAWPPTSRCQTRSSLHALIPPLISLLNPSSSRPAINGVKAITVGRFPLPCPGVPLPGHYKRTRRTPRPSPHSPRPQSLAFESVVPTPPSASSTDRSPLSPGRVRPSAAPSCSRSGSPPSPLHFSSTAVRFLAQGRRFGRSPTSLPRDGDRGPPWTGAAHGPRAHGLGPRVSFRKIIPGNSNFGHFALRPLGFSKINPQSKNLQLGLRI
jgi:hypothetical protein